MNIKPADLKSILKRLDRLDQEVFGSGGGSQQRLRGQAKSKTLPDVILDLKDSGFFKNPKTTKMVYKRLLSVYHTDLKKVDTALHRLRGRKELRIIKVVEGGRKVKAYVW